MNDMKKILELLISQPFVTMSELKNELHFSERKIRYLLQNLRSEGRQYKFDIVTVSKKGYFLKKVMKNY